MNDMKIIQYTKSKFANYTETKQNGIDWVKSGSDNLYPNFLLKLSNESSIHGAIISSKVDAICGSEIIYDKLKTESAFKHFFTKHFFAKQTDKNTDIFLNSVNTTGESLKSLIRKIAYDYVIFGGFSLNIIWTKDKKSIAEIYHIDFSKIRCQHKNEIGKIENYYYCNDWKNYRRKENEPVLIPTYNSNKGGSQLLYITDYQPGREYYPLPSYNAALNYCEIDVEISNYHLSNIKNGMAPSMMITFTDGKPSIDEANTIKRQITETYCGSDNTGKIIVNFANDSTSVPQITKIDPAQIDKQFIQLQEAVMQNILTGHKITSPMLVGIKTDGQLGGNTELENAYSIYLNTVIIPMQNTIMESINKLGNINGAKELTLVTNSPLKFIFSEQTLLAILSIDEMREIIGYDAVTQEITPTEEVIPEDFDNDMANVSEIKKIVNNESNDIEKQAKARLKGSVGCVQGILQIQKSVADGITDYNSGLTILDLIYGISELDAKKILGIQKNNQIL